MSIRRSSFEMTAPLANSRPPPFIIAIDTVLKTWTFFLDADGLEFREGGAIYSSERIAVISHGDLDTPRGNNA
jgi:hypothetical protein